MPLKLGPRFLAHATLKHELISSETHSTDDALAPPDGQMKGLRFWGLGRFQVTDDEDVTVVMNKLEGVSVEGI